MNIRIVQNDITALPVDAIVNAANCSLLGGGGVDGAIHAAAGAELLNVCRALGGCDTGEARITPGFRLKAKFIIHTPGPVWQGGDNNEIELLRSCYINSLQLALVHKCRSIAFPCISTGVYNFPRDLAAEIALTSAFQWRGLFPLDVVFCCFAQSDVEIYKTTCERLLIEYNETLP